MEGCQTHRAPNVSSAWRILAAGVAQGLETPMHLTFDPLSAAWDTFKFWEEHETSTDNPTDNHLGLGRRPGLRADPGEPSRTKREPGSGPGTKTRRRRD